jgi:hypothetical protein
VSTTRIRTILIAFATLVTVGLVFVIALVCVQTEAPRWVPPVAGAVVSFVLSQTILVIIELTKPSRLTVTVARPDDFPAPTCGERRDEFGRIWTCINPPHPSRPNSHVFSAIAPSPRQEWPNE